MFKITSLIVVLLVSVNASAQFKKTYKRVKQVVTGSANMAELHYFPEQWEMDLNVGYRYTNLDLKGTTTGNTQIDATQKQSLLKGLVTLGVLSNTYVQVAWDYLASMNTSYAKPTNQSDLTSKGITDPQLILVVRAFDGQSVKLDLKGAFQLSLGDHKSSDSTHDGDALSGGNEIKLGGRIIALATDTSQLSASVDYSLVSLQNSVNQSNNQITEDEKHNELLIELATMTKVTSDFYFGVLLEIANVDSHQSTNLSTLVKSNNGTVSVKTLNAVAKYAFNPDMLVEGEFGYLLDYTGSSDNIDISASGYSLSASYQIRF